MSLYLNVGSGQRPFPHPWTNIDIAARDGQKPQIQADGQSLPFADGSAAVVVLHHCLEHFGCGEADTVLKEAHRVLKPGGSLLLFVPNIRALAQRWLTRQMDDFTYICALMGAFQGLEGDRHKWHYTFESLGESLKKAGEWQRIGGFDWRPVHGADLARDFWIMGVEAVR